MQENAYRTDVRVASMEVKFLERGDIGDVILSMVFDSLFVPQFPKLRLTMSICKGTDTRISGYASGRRTTCIPSGICFIPSRLSKT